MGDDGRTLCSKPLGSELGFNGVSVSGLLCNEINLENRQR
jgi:hypothetical protein